jgi:hypothetical protein
MFARFCGFGPGHKSTRLVTKIFRDEIKEAFGIGHGRDDIGETFEEKEPDNENSDNANEELEVDFESDDDTDSEENSEYEDSDLFDRDYFELEEELGYAPL